MRKERGLWMYAIASDFLEHKVACSLQQVCPQKGIKKDESRRGLELFDASAAEFLHEAGDRAIPGWCGQRMDMIVHRQAGEPAAVGVKQSLSQQRQVTPSTDIVEKARKATVAT
ncbi:MAG: hypothetical protein ABI870_09420 [Rhodanobacter sp.]